MFEKRDRIKYAKAMRTIDYGWMGYPVSLFRNVTLTTKMGNDNSVKGFREDIKHLLKKYKREGVEIEYCGVLSPTPEKGLMHMHSIWRVKGGKILKTGADGDKERKDLRKKWREIHGAWNVDIKLVKTHDRFKEYVVKHLLKDMVVGDVRITCSRGWKRGGYKEVEEIILGMIKAGRSSMLVSRREWEVYREACNAWAKGENKLFKMIDGSMFLIRNRSIIVEDKVHSTKVMYGNAVP